MDIQVSIQKLVKIWQNLKVQVHATSFESFSNRDENQWHEQIAYTSRKRTQEKFEKFINKKKKWIKKINNSWVIEGLQTQKKTEQVLINQDLLCNIINNKSA